MGSMNILDFKAPHLIEGALTRRASPKVCEGCLYFKAYPEGTYKRITDGYLGRCNWCRAESGVAEDTEKKYHPPCCQQN